MNKLIIIKDFLSKHKITVFALISVLCYGLSFINVTLAPIRTETNKLQKRLISREKTLEEYAQKALIIPIEEWLSFDNFPDDMVLYRYNADTLQSWINLFPISNDEVNVIAWWYRMHDMGTRDFYNTPLAYIGEREQYINLGLSWYVVKVYENKGIKVITGLLIKTEYISENSLLSSNVSPKLKLSDKYTTVPIKIDDGNVVYGQNEDPLFSVINNSPLTNITHHTLGLEWLSLCFFLLALLLYHNSKRNLQSFIIIITGLTLGRISTILISKDLVFTTEIFSPSIYADSDFFNSLGDLLLNHLFIFLIAVALSMNGKGILMKTLEAGFWQKWLIRVSQITFIIIIASYIHTTLKSIILNSTLVLELFRVQENTIYSILIYLSYALLFLALLFAIQSLLITFKQHFRLAIFKTKGILIYTLIVSIYTIFAVGYYGFEREFETTKVFTNRLSTERDLSLELELIKVEKKIASDHIVSRLMPYQKEWIRYRLLQSYFWELSEKYDITLTICGSGETLSSSHGHEVDCFDFFNNKLINKYGIPVDDNSAFYYLNNYNDESNYIGKFSYIKNSRRFDMYIQVDSKTANETIGYPSLLIDSENTSEIGIPSIYSYAKYQGNKLTSFHGRYNYPYLLSLEIEEGASSIKVGGYIHFLNKIANESTIMISRPTRDITPHLISFSYILLFFSAIMLGGTSIPRKVRRKTFHLPKRSFRRKITFLITTSLVFSLICMGAGSIIFTINLMDENNRVQMEEKLQSVQTTISEMCKSAQDYTDINTPMMHGAMDIVAKNTQVDINLYDPHGRLLRSTKPEVFDQSLISSRINPKAFYDLIYRSRREVIQKEQIADLKYYSLYAPIFNAEGTLITIVNIPYFTIASHLHGSESSSIIAAIINLYLLLLIAAFLGGSTISNSLTKPLLEINKKMKTIGLSQAEHINYKNRDELGVLVTTYNKMVDDLEKSTKQLAESEREQAWKEMARQIAHEIKNPLTPMRLSIQHLVRMKQQNVPNWEDRFETLSASLIEQIDILSETATEFSSFAKFYNEEDSIINLVSLIKEQLILFDNRENIHLSFICNLELATVLAKKSQLTRALVNLISNAIQAVEVKKDGKVRISISIEDSFYKIEIEDNGTGVSEENRNKLFKPNFTTKSGGTGLGLAICKSIMDQSQGSIGYSQSDLGGANFIIKLPILQ